MSQFNKGLSNVSYTNKDFNTIYPELLDLAKSLSYKWDPTVSDESDPAVVLVKLAALMTDKINYVSDKNILEATPWSVTQLGNARAIFDQCGYSMKHYNSATVDLKIRIDVEPTSDTMYQGSVSLNTVSLEDSGERTYTIPRFTMVSDSENSLVYTTVKPVQISSNKAFSNVTAIQGVKVDYDVDGDTIINSAHLDHQRRLYFTELNVAENGIFIRNVNSDSIGNYDSWQRVDNLETQPLNKPCYKFGVTRDGTRCYIQFPSNIDNLIGDGLNITYVVSDGLNGNAGRKILTQLYTDSVDGVKVEFDSYTATTTLNNDNLYIINDSSAANGKDPESIDDAWLNYERIKGTFDTLVTLQDYNNFLKTSGKASNGVVCDRTNDPQRSINIMTQNVTGNKSVETKVMSKVKTVTDTSGVEREIVQPSMEPYDLCIYALQHVDNVIDAVSYNKTFEILNNISDTASEKLIQLRKLIEDNKSLQHNFINYESNRPIMIFNKYPIKAKVVPQFKLTASQIKEVLKNVKESLYKALNASKLEFGAPISYNDIYDTILDADARIKTVVLDSISYTTHVCYEHAGSLKHLELQEGYLKQLADGNANINEDEKRIIEEIVLKSLLSGATPALDITDTFSFSLEQEALYFGATPVDDVNSPDSNTNVEQVPGSNEYAVKGTISSVCQNIKKVSTSTTIPVQPSSGDPIDTEVTYSCGWTYDAHAGTYKINETDYDGILEVSSGSILVKLPSNLYCDNTLKFKIMLDKITVSGEEDYTLILDDIAVNAKGNIVTTNEYVNLSLVPNTGTDSETYRTCIKVDNKSAAFVWGSGSVSYTGVQKLETSKADVTVLENENVVFTAPNLILHREYSSYCKFISNVAIPKNIEYFLKEGEYVLCMWKVNNDDAYYTYNKYTKGTVICSTFDISVNSNDVINHSSLDKLVDRLGVNAESGTIKNAADNTIIKDLISSRYVLSGVDSITAKKLNVVTINNTTDGTTSLFWILNTSSVREGKNVSYLFDDSCLVQIDGKDVLQYELKPGEYLIYPSQDKTIVNILGTGTRIRITVDTDANRGEILSALKTSLVCPVVSYEEMLQEGPIDYLADKWCYCETENTYAITATEMQYVQLGEGCTITFENKTGSTTAFNLTNEVRPLTDYIISYLTSDSTEPKYLSPISDLYNGWSCHAILNFVATDKNPQKLLALHNHKIEFEYERIPEGSNSVHISKKVIKCPYITTDFVLNYKLLFSHSLSGTIGADGSYTGTLKIEKDDNYIFSTDIENSSIVLSLEGEDTIIDASNLQSITLTPGEYTFIVRGVADSDFILTYINDLTVQLSTINGTIGENGMYTTTLHISDAGEYIFLTNDLKKPHIALKRSEDSISIEFGPNMPVDLLEGDYEVTVYEDTRPDVYVSTSSPVNVLGGTNVDVTTIDAAGQLTYIDAYTFKRTTSDVDKNTEKYSDNEFDTSVRLEYDSAQGCYSKSLSFRLPEGFKYIIPICPRVETSKFEIYEEKVEDDGVSSETLLSTLTQNTDLKDCRVYYILEDVSTQNSQLTWKIKAIPKITWTKSLDDETLKFIEQEDVKTIKLEAVKAGDGSISVNIAGLIVDLNISINDSLDISITGVHDPDSPPEAPQTFISYDNIDKILSVNFQKGEDTRVSPIKIVIQSPSQVRKDSSTDKNYYIQLLNDDATLKYMDNDNIFDFAHVPETPILNPLAASSFVQNNHPYNHITICQWDLSNIEKDIEVLNSIRS